MILLFPYGGLCNRLRAYDAGLTLSRISKTPLFVFWEKNAELNCSFSSLYLQPTGSSYTFNISPNTRAVLEKAFSPFCTKITQETIREIGVGANKYSQLAKKNLLIFSFSRFYYSNSDINNQFLSFQPVKGIQDKIYSITRKFDSKTIGVHIRRTDNKQAIENSPVEKFMELMEHALIRDPQTRFFLATDSPKDEQIFLQLFKNVIITYTKTSLDRNDPLAIQDAVVDLHCLSHCNKIFGSYWSSFSDVAAKIGRSELHIVR